MLYMTISGIVYRCLICITISNRTILSTDHQIPSDLSYVKLAGYDILHAEGLECTGIEGYVHRTLTRSWAARTVLSTLAVHLAIWPSVS